MAAAGDHVFISYSRRDYYFAESLSFDLRQRGVPAWMDVLQLQPGSDWSAALHQAIDECAAFVLVVSPAALASPHVRVEWQRALAEGRRIVLLGWHRRVKLPAELQGCEWLDFRGRFGTAIGKLVATLAAPEAALPRAGPQPGRVPSMPPAVWAVWLALLWPIVAYGLIVAPDTDRSDFRQLDIGLGVAGDTLLAVLFGAFLVWGLSFSLLQRKMGLTRMALCLGFVALPSGLILWSVLRRGAEGLSYLLPGVAERALLHMPWVWATTAVPLLALLWILCARPLGLLRWMPTGKGWDAFRSGMRSARAAAVPGAHASLATLRSFSLLHEVCDQPLADRLRTDLRQHGAAELPPGTGGATGLLLLTQRSARTWLSQAAQRLADAPSITVVGSAIAQAPEFGRLWQRQWIDLRRWDLERPRDAVALPGLPEAVSSLRLPAPVATLHAALCALAALLMVLGFSLEPQVRAGGDEVTLPQALGSAAALALAWLARLMARREAALVRMKRLLLGGMAAGVPGMALLATQAEPAPGTGPLIWGGVAVAMLLCVGVWRLLPGAAFWLPLDIKPLPAAERLKPPGDWRTLLTVLAFMMLWMLPISVFAPVLLDG